MRFPGFVLKGWSTQIAGQETPWNQFSGVASSVGDYEPRYCLVHKMQKK